jgi:hypothetical protein
MVIGGFYVSNEMLAEGVEAKREAEARRLTESEIVLEIYMAMAGTALKMASDGEASIQ